MDAAWEAGITTFDTADAYGGGRSETLIGEWLRTKGAGRPRRDRPLDEDVQPDGRGRGSRARAGAREAPARVEPAPARRRARADVPHPRLGPRRADRRDRRRARRARARGQDRRLRPRATSTARSSAKRSPPALRLGAELVLAARPRGGGRGAAALRGARPRLHALQPARGRLAHRQVPARRAAAAGLADDACGPSRTSTFATIGSSTRSRRSSASRTPGTTPAALAIAWLLADPRVTGGRRRPPAAGPPRARPCGPRRAIDRETIELVFGPAGT